MVGLQGQDDLLNVHLDPAAHKNKAQKHFKMYESKSFHILDSCILKGDKILILK